MPNDRAEPAGPVAAMTGTGEALEPSFGNALLHYLPLLVFPLIVNAAIYGGWWFIAPFVFFMLAGPLDVALGAEERNMDPAATPDSRLLLYNLPVWLWAALWPPTLAFGLWQILVSGDLAVWEGVLLAVVLTVEAQAVFIVGHELIHRRSVWERRVGELLLASASYPQYATEHIYIHHALVGTPMDYGSAPKGQSFWNYFPREVASNFSGSWRVERERLARRGLAVWHYGNPFWRYVVETGFWYALVWWMGGWWAVLVFVLLCLSTVFSMKLSNYIQHYGLRRIRLPGGRFERAGPRHSWSASCKFSNWMFYNMQRHPDHHTASNRRYPVLQHCGEDESPQLPGSYGKLFSIAVFPGKWFRTMDPLVDRWRAKFYPEIEDWSAYDSPAFFARPEAFEAIDEIFSTAPRLIPWVNRSPDLLDTLADREFTDLDLPRGFGPDPETEAIARRGLARLYWTHEYTVAEMVREIADIPAIGVDDTVETVRGWSDGKAFQVAVHTIRDNLTPIEAGIALSNIAEASIAAVLTAVDEDFAARRGAPGEGGLAVALLGDLASREAAFGTPIDILCVHDGGEAAYYEGLCREFADALRDLSEGSLFFPPVPPGQRIRAVRSLAAFEEHHRGIGSPGELLELTRARCVFTRGDAGVVSGFDAARRGVLTDGAARDALVAELRRAAGDAPKPGIASIDDMEGGFRDIERAARLLQLTQGGARRDDPAPTAGAVFESSGAEGTVSGDVADRLADVARLWRNLRSALTLSVYDGSAVRTARARFGTFVARCGGVDDVDALTARIAETAARTAADIDALAGAGEN